MSLLQKQVATKKVSDTFFPLACVVVAMVAMGGRCCAQADAEPKYASWTRLEGSPETREYKERLKEASSLDQASQAFLAGQALPQLAREENRGSIERVRRRMREVLLTEIANKQVLVAANEFVAGFMEKLARDDAADPVARVNAAILIGELRGADGRPWPDGAVRLAGLARDAKVAMGVRAAAVGGLHRYGTMLAENPQLTGPAGGAVMAILSEAGAANGKTAPRPEAEWLAGRAVSLLPSIAAEHPKPVAEAVVRIVMDQSRSIDTRVRAAAALAAGASGKAAIDAAAVVAAIESIAVKALDDELSAAERLRFDTEYRRMVAGDAGPVPGSGGPPVGPGEDLQSIPENVIRRDAWRLVTLAGALDGGVGAVRSGKGIAGLAQGPVAQKATSLAETLRQAGLALDANASEQSLVSVLDTLRPQAEPRAGRPAGGAAGIPEAADASDGQTRPGQPREAAGTGEPADSATPDRPGQQDRPGQPGRSGQPGRPGTPASPTGEPAPSPSPFESSPFG